MSKEVITKEKLDMNPKYLLHLTLFLLAISAIVAMLLGVVNGVTAQKIAAINAEKTAKAMAAVVEDEASEFEKLDKSEAAVAAALANNASKLIDIYSVLAGGEQVGFVAEITTGGSQGDINMVVGVDMNGAITGCSIVKMVETAGLGTKANDEAWRAQFVGGSEPFAVDKDGGSIAAISGATVSSRAVTTGVNAALAAVAAQA